MLYFPHLDGGIMNIFEGSRRISYVTATVISVFVLYITFTEKPYVYINYVVKSPLNNPERINQDCPYNGKTTTFTKKWADGEDVNIHLCILPMEFEENGLLIPYKFDAGGFWGAEKYTKEVSDYQKRLESKFSLSKEDVDHFTKEKSKAYWGKIKKELSGLAIGLIIFFCFTWVIGWIVRGFAGIPRGMDKKPK